MPLKQDAVITTRNDDHALILPLGTYPADDQTMSKIQPGDHVKIQVVSASGKTEKFWCVVNMKGDSVLSVRVDNDLYYTQHHGLSYEDSFPIHERNVLAYMPA